MKNGSSLVDKLVDRLREIEHEYSYAEVLADSNSKQGEKAKERLASLAEQYQKIEHQLNRLDKK